LYIAIQLAIFPLYIIGIFLIQFLYLFYTLVKAKVKNDYTYLSKLLKIMMAFGVISMIFVKI
jgi:hypothetical protein